MLVIVNNVGRHIGMSDLGNCGLIVCVVANCVPHDTGRRRTTYLHSLINGVRLTVLKL